MDVNAADALTLNEILLSETARSYNALGVELVPSDAVKNTRGLATARLRALLPPALMQAVSRQRGAWRRC